jgi:hypothetical protein
MPTGYTYPIEDGTLTEFPQFALNCARAFGACIEMRDDPLDKPIPDEFQPSTYHTDAVLCAKGCLASLLVTSPEAVMEKCDEDYIKAVHSYEEAKAERALHNVRYAAMREKVEAWTPPTPDHENLKKFMLEQIDVSVSTYAWTGPERETPAAYLARRIEQANKDILYHTQQAEQDRRQAEQRTSWVRALRESLVSPAPDHKKERS